MSVPIRRLIKWIGYLIIAAGFASSAMGVVGVVLIVVGPADQRANNLGLAVTGFGGGLANVLVGYGFLWISRSGAHRTKM
jgi:hypothetical protein